MSKSTLCVYNDLHESAPHFQQDRRSWAPLFLLHLVGTFFWTGWTSSGPTSTAATTTTLTTSTTWAGFPQRFGRQLFFETFLSTNFFGLDNSFASLLSREEVVKHSSEVVFTPLTQQSQVEISTLPTTCLDFWVQWSEKGVAENITKQQHIELPKVRGWHTPEEACVLRGCMLLVWALPLVSGEFKSPTGSCSPFYGL